MHKTVIAQHKERRYCKNQQIRKLTRYRNSNNTRQKRNSNSNNYARPIPRLDTGRKLLCVRFANCPMKSKRQAKQPQENKQRSCLIKELCIVYASNYKQNNAKNKRSNEISSLPRRSVMQLSTLYNSILKPFRLPPL